MQEAGVERAQPVVVRHPTDRTSGRRPDTVRDGSVACRAHRDDRVDDLARARPRARRAPRPAGRQLRQRLADLAHRRRAGDARVATAPGRGIPERRRLSHYDVWETVVGQLIGGRRSARAARSATRSARSPRCGTGSSASPRTATTSSRSGSPRRHGARAVAPTASAWSTTNRSATRGSARGGTVSIVALLARAARRLKPAQPAAPGWGARRVEARPGTARRRWRRTRCRPSGPRRRAATGSASPGEEADVRGSRAGGPAARRRSSGSGTASEYSGSRAKPRRRPSSTAMSDTSSTSMPVSS